MISAVQLRRAEAAQRDTTAWFLAGGDPAAWLEEVARWSVAADALRFFPVAHEGGVDVAGVLAVLPPGAPALDPERVRGLPYGCVAPDFFVPVEARLSPPMSPEELRAAARFAVLVFHPALGLTGFENSDGARVTNWLAAPLAAPDDWSVARAGPTSLPSLRAVRLQVELSLEELFGEESKDIGSKSDTAPPPAPDEPKINPVTGALLGGGALLAKGILALTSLAPHTASAPTWINDLENWLGGKLSGRAADLERERNKELHRLLHLLQTNPEEGLKFALPLAALLNRGRAAPSARLGQRSTDFNLGRLGGGRAADAWDVPSDLRTSLSKSYREQAMRELKLGRHRRAAYIFAELLGDFAAAADALKQGRHFPEAAVLYRERLHNPIAAAQCLAEGGLLHEAIVLYEKHDRWMEAADLYAKLGDRAGEVRSVRRVVDTHRKSGDTLAAARLLDSRLVETEEALALLAATWPNDRQAMACLDERFAIFQRLRRDEAAEDLVRELTAHATANGQLAPLANVLAKLAETPGADSRLRALAAEGVRVKAAAALTGRKVDSSDELAILRALTRLAPGDKLLARDTLRFRAERQKPPPPALKTAPKHAPVRRLTLMPGAKPTFANIVSWFAVRHTPDGFVALGGTPNAMLKLVQGLWRGPDRDYLWRDPQPEMKSTLVFAASSELVLVARPFAAPLALGQMVRTDGMGVPNSAGTPPWLPAGSVAADWSQSSFWVVRTVGERILLDCFHREKLTSSRDVTDELVAAGATGGGTALRINAGAGGGRVALGYGHHLLVLENQREVRVQDLGARVLDVVAAPGTTPGWVVALERGAVFVAADGSAVRPLDEQIESPHVAVLRLGEVIVAGAEGGFVFRLQPDRVETVGSFVLPGGAGAAITPTNELNEFAVFREGGVVQRWRLGN